MGEKKSGKVVLPRISQIGIIVKDVDKAMEYYSKNFNLGPWDISIAERKDAIAHGKVTDYEQKLAFTMLGDVQIELMHVLEGRPVQLEFLEEKGEVVQHFGFRVDDIDAEIEKWEKNVIKCTQHYKPGSAVRYVMMDTSKTGGVTFELLQEPHKTEEKSLK